MTNKEIENMLSFAYKNNDSIFHSGKTDTERELTREILLSDNYGIFRDVENPKGFIKTLLDKIC